MPANPLTRSEVEGILLRSEDKATSYAGADQNPDGPAHALARHHYITNSGLMDRRDTQGRNGAIAFFSAFITRADMIDAALDALNGPGGLWARTRMFEGVGAQDGMRAIIDHLGALRRVRYAGGAGIIPTAWTRMLLDRFDARPCRLHIHTFYPALDSGRAGDRVELKRRDGGGFARFPGP